MKHFIATEGSLAYEYIDKTSDKTLLCIHGFMEDHEVWNDLVAKLNVNIILVDLFGFGESNPHNDFDFSLENQAKAVAELLHHLEPKNLYVLGHSMGGYITLELLKIYYPFNAGLLHSTPLADSEEKKANRNKTIEVLQKDPVIFIREFYWNLFAENTKDKYAALIEKMKTKAGKIPVDHIITTIKALRDRNDNQPAFEKAEGKKIWISGKNDKLIGFGETKKLAEEANIEFVELSTSGHMGFYEEPDALLKAVKNWLK